MTQYRILKKINYRYRDNFYPKAYIIQVKKFLFWEDIKWWVGSDVSDENFWKTHLKKSDGSKRPHPYDETQEKYGNKCFGGYGNTIFFFEEEPAKFFLSKVIELDQYFYDVKHEHKDEKEKAVDIIYINKDKNEEKSNIIIL